MVITLSNYILEQSVSDASVNDIELERLFAEMNVICSLSDLLMKETDLIQEGVIASEFGRNFAKIGSKWSQKSHLSGSTLQLAGLTVDIVIALIDTGKTAASYIESLYNPNELEQYRQHLTSLKEQAQSTTDKSQKKSAVKEIAVEYMKHTTYDINLLVDFFKKFMNFINPFTKTTEESKNMMTAYLNGLQQNADAMSNYTAPQFSGTSWTQADVDTAISVLDDYNKAIQSSDLKDIVNFFRTVDKNSLRNNMLNAFNSMDQSELNKLNMSLKRASSKAQNMVRDFSKYATANKKQMIIDIKNKNLNHANIPMNTVNKINNRK